MGYVDLGVYDLTADSTVKAELNTANLVYTESTLDSTLFLSYAVKLTPAADDALADFYYQTGKTYYEYVNESEDKAAAFAKVGEAGFINTHALNNMKVVYTALQNVTFTSDYDLYSKFNEEIEKNLETVEYVTDKIILNTGAGKYYTRTKPDMNTNRHALFMYSGITKSGYDVYDVAFKPTMKIKNGVAVTKYAQTVYPITNTFADISSDAAEIAEYENTFTSLNAPVYTRGDSVVLDGVKPSADGSLALYVSSSDTFSAGTEMENTLVVRYDTTTAEAEEEPALAYKIDKVSYVSCTTGENAGKGYIGSAMITKQRTDAKNGVVIAAAYDANDRLLEAKPCEFSGLVKGTSTKIEIGMYSAKPAKVKVFVWDNIDDSITPMADIFTINNPTNTDADGDAGSLWYLPDGTTQQP